MNGFFFKWSRFNFLYILLGVFAGIVLIHLEENWRGAHQFATTKAEWEAKGESFDSAKFVPPPVPDDQNLAALPLFKLESMTNKDGVTFLGTGALQRAMRDVPPSTEIPKTGSWSLGELPDIATIRTAIAANYAAIFKDTKPPASALAQIDALYPFLAELRIASASRPQFRLNLDYLIDPPQNRPLQPVTSLIRLSKLLSLHAILALHEHQADLALADLKLNREISLGAARDPSYVGGLVAIGMHAIGNVVIYDGLAEHLWSDAQLAGIDAMLKPVDFLSNYRFAIRCDLLSSLGTLDDARKPGHHAEGTELFLSGWWDDNKRKIALNNFQKLTFVDPSARRVFPDAALRQKAEHDRAAAKWTALAPWNMFATIFDLQSLPVEKFSEAQVSVDETRIACALERYRLAKGAYPPSLDALAPAYLAAVPHDIMNGESYHYQLHGDGTFLLYSVGWNQADDGGKIAFRLQDPKTIDYENGDWVWPSAK